MKKPDRDNYVFETEYEYHRSIYDREASARAMGLAMLGIYAALGIFLVLWYK